MALDEKDKQKIEEEEAYRAEIREQKRNIAVPQPKKKGMGILGWLLIIFIGLIAILFMTINPSKQIEKADKAFEASQNDENQNSNATSTPEKQNTFVASVHFTENQFVVANVDPHTCEDAKMQVNGDYTLEHYNLESSLDSVAKTSVATVYKVNPGQFTKSDGTRFNPFITKPKTFSIECRGSNELFGAFWYGEF